MLPMKIFDFVKPVKGQKTIRSNHAELKGMYNNNLLVLQDYMSQFGYVLDVYMPRDKVKRTEHRGFGFVTFETNAAIERVALNAPHRIKWVHLLLSSNSGDSNKLDYNKLACLKLSQFNSAVEVQMLVRVRGLKFRFQWYSSCLLFFVWQIQQIQLAQDVTCLASIQSNPKSMKRFD